MRTEPIRTWRTSTYSSYQGACVEVTAYRKSTHSFETGCVEVGQSAQRVAIRDTVDRGGAVISVSAAAWRELTRRVRRLP